MDLPISSVSLNHSWFREADADYFITINASATTKKEYYPFLRFNGTKLVFIECINAFLDIWVIPLREHLWLT